MITSRSASPGTSTPTQKLAVAPAPRAASFSSHSFMRARLPSLAWPRLAALRAEVFRRPRHRLVRGAEDQRAAI
jgi:hypothetical protein